MSKQRIIKIIYAVIFVFLLVSNLYFCLQNYQVKQECKTLYEKETLTAEDLKAKSAFIAARTTTYGEEGEASPAKVSYRKLYGVEYIGKYEINENEGIEVSFWHGDPAKTLILDKDGNEMFYEEATELGFEPGKAGKYDVYIVGNKFTGKVEIKTYQCE